MLKLTYQLQKERIVILIHKKRASFLFVFVLVALMGLTMPALAEPEVKNVIMMIGDGMGISHITAARNSLEDGAYSELNLDSMPYTGFSVNFSTSHLVTDSAAAATALATGFRTDNGRLATLPDGTPVKSILLAAQEQGLSTGVVATVNVTDATPAAYLVQADSRTYEKSIAESTILTNVDVLLGGGLDLFGVNMLTKKIRSSSLANQAIERGYTFVYDRDGLMELEVTPDLKLLGLFMGDDMSYEIQRYNIEPHIVEMTSKALEIVGQNPDGFFLMVEGSKIDRASHRNYIDEMIGDMLAFDEAIGVALDYAKEHPQTLVIVTADHETGGLGITGGHPSGEDAKHAWIHTGHTGAMVPIYAFGPGAHRFTGTLQITDIPIRIAELMGIPNFPSIIEQEVEEIAN